MRLSENPTGTAFWRLRRWARSQSPGWKATRVRVCMGSPSDSVEQWLPSATRDNEAERRREAAHDLFGRGSSRVSGQQVEIKVDVRNSRAVDVVSADDAHRSLQRGIHY